MLFWGEVKTKTQQTRKYSLSTLHPPRWQFQHSFPMECQCVIWTKGKRSPKENKTKTLSSMGQDLNHEWAKHHKIFLEEPPPPNPANHNPIWKTTHWDLAELFLYHWYVITVASWKARNYSLIHPFLHCQKWTKRVTGTGWKKQGGESHKNVPIRRRVRLSPSQEPS